MKKYGTKQDYYNVLSKYGDILYTKDLTTNSGYATIKLIEYKQCLHVVDMLNGTVQEITIIF